MQVPNDNNDEYYRKYRMYKRKYIELKLYHQFAYQNYSNYDINNLEGGLWPFTSKPKSTPTSNQPTKAVVYAKVAPADIKNVGGKERKSTKFPSFYTFLRWTYRGVKFGTSATGTVVSLGEGGDTLPDLVFLMMDLGFLSANLASLMIVNPEVKPYMEAIFKIPWTGNPAETREQVLELLAQIKTDPQAEEIINTMCMKFQSIIDTLAAVFGSSVAVFIPDDAGVSRLVLETTISEASRYANQIPYVTASTAFGVIPQSAKDILTDKKKLVKFLTSVISFIKNLFPTSEGTFIQNLQKNVKRIALSSVVLLVSVIPGGIFFTGPILTGTILANFLVSSGMTGDQVIKMINYYVEPNINGFADLILKSMSLTFCALTFLEHCGQG